MVPQLTSRGRSRNNGNFTRESERQDFIRAGNDCDAIPCHFLNCKSLTTTTSHSLRLLTPYLKMMLGRFFGLSKQTPSKDDSQVQEPQTPEPQTQAQGEVDAAEPSTDVASAHEPLVVSPNFAKEVMFDLPVRSAEDPSSIVNELSFNDEPSSSPKTSALGKRKRQETDVRDGSHKMQAAKGEGATTNGDELPTTSTNATGDEGRSNHVSTEAVQVAPGKKLSRPKQKQIARHMIQIYPAEEKGSDTWNLPPSPKKQVENSAAPPAVTRRKFQSPEVTPRRRGRPPRVEVSEKQKVSPIKPGQGRKEQDPGAKYQVPAESSTQRLGTQISRSRKRPDHMQGAPKPRLTRFTVGANGHEDAVLNAPIDLTKKPERDARKAAKQRKSLELASVSTVSGAKADAVTNSRNKIPALRERNGGKQNRKKVLDNGVSNSRTSPRLQNRAASEEYKEGEREGEEGEGEEKEGEGEEEEEEEDEEEEEEEEEGEEEGGSEVEEVDSDVEASTEAIESEGKELELFGRDEEWKTVLEGARSICGPNLPRNQMPKLLTGTIRDLVQHVKETRDLYGQLSSSRKTDDDSSDDLIDSLRESLETIEDHIKGLSETTAAKKSSEMISDIYARAIPAMVFLLQSALSCRVYHSEGPCDLETLNETLDALREVVHLQKMGIFLCEKARIWKAKPVLASGPIVKPTTHKILPGLRDMTKAFSQVLLEQDKKRRSKQNAVDYNRRQRELNQSAQQAKQEAARKNELLQRKIRESREQEDLRRRNGKQTLRQIREEEARKELLSHQVNGHAESRTTWSDAEDVALYFQLEKGYAGGLTCRFMGSHLLCHCCSLITLAAAERYLNILNTPLLQNKLPEHIRERALYFKPTLLEERGALEWISSIE